MEDSSRGSNRRKGCKSVYQKEKSKTEHPFRGNENHTVSSFDRLEQSKAWEMPNSVI